MAKAFVFHGFGGSWYIFIHIYIQPPWFSMAAAGRQIMPLATAVQLIIRQVTIDQNDSSKCIYIYIYTSLSLGKFLKNIFSTDDLPKKSTPISYLGKRSLGTPSLGGGFKYFLFSTLLGEMIPNLTSIFFGWVETNHQPDQHIMNIKRILLAHPSAFYRLFDSPQWKKGPLAV